MFDDLQLIENNTWESWRGISRIISMTFLMWNDGLIHNSIWDECLFSRHSPHSERDGRRCGGQGYFPHGLNYFELSCNGFCCYLITFCFFTEIINVCCNRQHACLKANGNRVNFWSENENDCVNSMELIIIRNCTVVYLVFRSSALWLAPILLCESSHVKHLFGFGVHFCHSLSGTYSCFRDSTEKHMRSIPNPMRT